MGLKYVLERVLKNHQNYIMFSKVSVSDEKKIYILFQIFTVLKALKEKGFKNITGKRENADFLLFLLGCFQRNPEVLL